MKADVVVIGAGIVGAWIARELAKYDLATVVVEKESDVAQGASKANTAILHAGYDPEPGTLKAALCVRGNQLYDELAEQLHISIKRTGSLVVAFSDEETDVLRELLRRGIENGVQGLRIVDRDELRAIEPNLNPASIAGLYTRSAGIVNPFEAVLACAEEASLNGVRFILDTEVTGFTISDREVKEVATTHGRICTEIVVNASGVYADTVAGEAGLKTFKITPRKGEYMVLDPNIGDIVHTVLFPIPTTVSKGITVTPTTDGNILIGPTSEEIQDRTDVSTTQEGLKKVLTESQKLVPSISPRDVIRVFAGIRAVSDTNDFIIESSKDVEGFINVAGIQSPGVTAAPAIAEMVVKIVGELVNLRPKETVRRRHCVRSFRDASLDERRQLFQIDHRYGRVVCRCETVTEAEIVDAIHRVPGARTVDGVKVRTRAGMGRCQGSFCGPRVLEILCRELELHPSQVTLRGGGSWLLIGRCKRGIEDEEKS
ncbi:MAG: NAD(P)/FAD-dependent oxidoreductase [Candidatus Bathyarchaeia archaeon]